MILLVFLFVLVVGVVVDIVDCCKLLLVVNLCMGVLVMLFVVVVVSR